MDKTTRIMFVAAVCVAVLIITTQPVIACIDNGNFSSGNEYWHVLGDGCVSFENNNAYLSQGYSIDPPTSIIYQEVTLLDGEDTLSFDLLMECVSEEVGETDVFTVRIGGTLTCDETTGWLELFTGGETKSWTSTQILDEYDGTLDDTINFDVSNLAPGLHNLSFELDHDPTDYVCTTVTLDDVMLTSEPPIVPVPGALLLGGFGSALVVLLRRYV